MSGFSSDTELRKLVHEWIAEGMVWTKHLNEFLDWCEANDLAEPSPFESIRFEDEITRYDHVYDRFDLLIEHLDADERARFHAARSNYHRAMRPIRQATRRIVQQGSDDDDITGVREVTLNAYRQNTSGLRSALKNLSVIHGILKSLENRLTSRESERASQPVLDAATESRGWMGDVELAQTLGVHPSRVAAFRAKLRRMRDQRELSMDDWHEVENPKRNEPRFLYRANATAIVEMAKRYSRPE